MRTRKKGQTLVEYALILVLVGVAAVSILNCFSTQLQQAYANVATQLNNVNKQIQPVTITAPIKCTTNNCLTPVQLNF